MRPGRLSTVRRLECVTLNAWPGTQSYVLDGWIVQHANGFTRRANAVYPLWSPSAETESLIERCESIYEARNQPTLFKLTEESQPTSLEQRLTERGYRRVEEVSVRSKPLDDSGESTDERLTLTAGLPLSFVEAYSRLWNLSAEHTHTFEQMMCASLCETVCATVETDGRPVGCGLAVVDGAFVGLLGIHVDESVRRQGIGEAITTALLREGRSRGAETAWLQVEVVNTGASALYERLGFTEQYRYWYRTTG